MKKVIKRLFKIAVVAGLLFVIAVSAVNIYVVSVAKKSMYKTEDAEMLPLDADCIIVLGAGLKADGTPNHMLRDRLDLAIELYRNGVCHKILLTGDHGTKGYDEVNAMRAYMLEKGVDTEHIYLDHAGFSTYDSMYRAKAVFCVEKAIVITQRYHLYRSVYIAKKRGIDVYGINSDPYRYKGQEYRDVREVLARFKDYFAVMFNVKPKYLGEEIDISTAASYETR